MRFQPGNNIGHRFTKDNPRPGPGRPKSKEKQRLEFIDKMICKAEPLTPEEVAKVKKITLDRMEEGDPTCTKIIWDRFLPKTFNLSLPEVHLNTLEDVDKASNDLINKIHKSEVYVEDAEALKNHYDFKLKVIEKKNNDQFEKLVKQKEEEATRLECGQ